MAENALHSCQKNEELNARLKISSGKLSQYQYNSQWMAHWKQGKNSYYLSDSINKEHLPAGCLHTEHIKSRKLKMLSPDSCNECKNSPRPDTHELGLALYSHPSAEPLSEHQLPKGLKFNGMDIVLSDSLLHKLPDSYLHRGNKEKCQFYDMGDVSSEENLFPMYGINRKIDSILNPQKRIGHVNTTNKFSESPNAPEKIGLGIQISGSAEDHLFASWKTISTLEESAFFESVKGSSCFQENYRQSRTNGIFGHRIPNAKFYKSPREERCSLGTDQMLCKHSTEGLSEPLRYLEEKIEVGGLIAKGVTSLDQWKINCFTRLPRDTQSGGYNDRAVIHQTVAKMPDSCIHDVETLRTHTSSSSLNTINGETETISNSFDYWLITEKMSSKLPHDEQLNENLSCLFKGKGKALYEMLTVPTRSERHSRNPEFSQLVVSSSSVGDYDESDRSGTHGIEIRSQTSAKCATSSYACDNQRSAEALVSDKLHKDVDQPRLIKTYHASTSLAKQRLSGDTETYILDTNEFRHASSDRTGSIDKLKPGISRTESMNDGQTLFHWRPNVLSSAGIKQSSSQVEPCSRWLKRLRCNSLDYLQNNTKIKMPRIRHSPSTKETCTLFGKVTHCNTSHNDMMNAIEKQTCNERKYFPSKTEGPTKISFKEVQCWVGRWCHKHTQVASSQAKQITALDLLSKPEVSKSIPEDPEGKQFPSIGAMALMGKVMNNLHKCKFQRRGSSVVWKTENLE